MKNLLLTIVVVALSLLGLEGAMRMTLTPERLYGRLHTLPEHHQWRNEVSFWARYREPIGTHGQRLDSLDPLLGWDFDRAGDRIRGDRTISRGRQDDRFRVLLLGDSYVHGTDVTHEETFGWQLAERQPSWEVLNMGVPGYGIDQAYLKFRHFGAEYRPDLVVFGVYVSDYSRSGLSFTTFAKPRFRMLDGQVILENQPVPDAQSELARIERALAGRIYLLELLRNGWRKLQETAAQQTRYFDAMDPVITHILRRMKDELAPDQRLLILHIPRAEAFIEADDFRDAMGERLLRIYQALDLDVINLRQAFLEGGTPEQVYETHYVHFPDDSVGHLSATGHGRVARLIEQYASASSPGGS